MLQIIPRDPVWLVVTTCAMIGYAHLLLFSLSVFQWCTVAAMPPRMGAVKANIHFRDLGCTMAVQHQTGPEGFGNTYHKGNRVDYGPVPSKSKPTYNPIDLEGHVLMWVETATDNSQDQNYIKYKVRIQNTDKVVRHAQLAWFTPGPGKLLSPAAVPDYIFTIEAQPNETLQGCVILTHLSAQKQLTYQAF